MIKYLLSTNRQKFKISVQSHVSKRKEEKKIDFTQPYIIAKRDFLVYFAPKTALTDCSECTSLLVISS